MPHAARCGARSAAPVLWAFLFRAGTLRVHFWTTPATTLLRRDLL